MAFTKTPTGDTYNSKMIPLVYKWDQRGGTTVDDFDSQTINAIPEIVKDQLGGTFYNAYKRDGSTHIRWRNSTPPQPPHDTFADTVVAVWTNTATNNCLVIAAAPNTVGSVYRAFRSSGIGMEYGLDVDFITAGVPAIAAGVQVNFTDFVYDNGDVSTLYGVEGIAQFGMVKMSGGPSMTTVTSLGSNGDPTALDGYVFASDSKGNIWNSNLNDPTTWGASNFITAESFGDGLVRIARAGTYIVAFGTSSIEWFYDAANPTGSPLSVYTGSVRRVGYLGGLAANGDDLYFVGKAENGAIALYKITGLKLEKITDFSISRELIKYYTSRQLMGNFLTLNGHSLYTVTVWSVEGGQFYTIYYDLETGFFGQLDFGQDDGFVLRQVATLRLTGFESLEAVNMFCKFSGTNMDRLYGYSSQFSQDDGVNYTVRLRTQNYDFDTRRYKFGSRVFIHCDQPLGAPVVSNATLTWTTNDYRSPGGTRTVNIRDEFPTVHALGAFRRIAFTLTYTDQYPCRFSGLEIDYNIGGA